MGSASRTAEKAARFLAGLSPSMLQMGYLVDPSARRPRRPARVPSTPMACDLCAGIAATEALKVLLGRGAGARRAVRRALRCLQEPAEAHLATRRQLAPAAACADRDDAATLRRGGQREGGVMNPAGAAMGTLRARRAGVRPESRPTRPMRRWTSSSRSSTSRAGRRAATTASRGASRSFGEPCRGACL